MRVHFADSLANNWSYALCILLIIVSAAYSAFKMFLKNEHPATSDLRSVIRFLNASKTKSIAIDRHICEIFRMKVDEWLEGKEEGAKCQKTWKRSQCKTKWAAVSH